MTYYVIDPSGASYGPADEALLFQWAQEGRLLPTSTIRDTVSGQTMVARAVPGLFPDPGRFPVQPLPMAPSPYVGRPAGLNNQDITVAWVCAGLSIVLSCGCMGLGIIPGIIGAVMSKRTLDQGNEAARAPMIVNIVGIAIGVVAIFLTFVVNFM